MSCLRFSQSIMLEVLPPPKEKDGEPTRADFVEGEEVPDVTVVYGKGETLDVGLNDGSMILGIPKAVVVVSS